MVLTEVVLPGDNAYGAALVVGAAMVLRWKGGNASPRSRIAKASIELVSV